MIVGALIGITAVCIIFGIQSIKNIIRHHKKLKELDTEFEKRFVERNIQYERRARSLHNKRINDYIKQKG